MWCFTPSQLAAAWHWVMVSLAGSTGLQRFSVCNYFATAALPKLMQIHIKKGPFCLARASPVRLFLFFFWNGIAVRP